jgi:hypothetical protein
MNDKLSFFYWTYKIPCWIQGTIIDIETTGLSAKECELVGLGLVKENRMSCFIRSLGTSDDAFRKWSISKVKRSPKPYIAFYHGFERQWFDESLSSPVDWVEIQPKNRHKKIYSVKLSHLGHDETGAVVPDAWHNEDIKTILWHLACDLFEELALYVSASHEYRRMRDPLKGILDFQPQEFNAIEFFKTQMESNSMLNEMNIEQFGIEWERKNVEIKEAYETIQQLKNQLEKK